MGTMLGLASANALTKYKGAMPGAKPLWKFCSQGESLCIYGIFLTSVSSHFASRQTDIKGTGPRVLNYVLHDALSGNVLRQLFSGCVEDGYIPKCGDRPE
jgi:hypothetical protein